VQQTENIFAGAQAAGARINLDAEPDASVVDAIRTGNADIFDLDLVRM
jgi:hypothetical protein